MKVCLVCGASALHHYTQIARNGRIGRAQEEKYYETSEMESALKPLHRVLFSRVDIEDPVQARDFHDLGDFGTQFA